MQDLSVCPFRLIQVIHILRESSQVDNSEIGTASRPTVRSRFTDIIETGPNLLSADKVIFLYQLQGFFVRTSPRGMTIVIRRTGIGRVIKRLVPAFRPNEHRITRHPIVSTRHQRRIAFRNDERLPRKILGHGWNIGIMVIVTDYIQCPGTKQMIGRIRLITSRRNRTGRV